VQAHQGIQKLLQAEHDATSVVKAAKDGRLPRNPLLRALPWSAVIL